MSKRLAAAAVVASLAAACATPYSPAPLATNFETSKQQKLQAAAHWSAIAKDVAAQLSTKVPQGTPLFVVQGEGVSSFQRAFAGQLTTALVESGYAVMRTPDGALRVGVETQSIPFAADRPQYRHAGKATALGAGLWALYDVAEHSTNAAGKVALLALGAGDAYAWFNSEFAAGATPATEIIVTTSVTDANRYVARNTSVYYVADEDRRLYTAPNPVKEFKVVGGE